MPIPAVIPVPATRLTRLSLVSADQCFPAYLKTEFSQLQSLSLDGISLIRGEFFPLLNAGHLLPGMSNLTSLVLKNIPNLPRIILASCVVLQKLDIEAVRIVEDESRRIPLYSVTRPQLTALLCKSTDETTLAQLVSIMDVTRLRSFECDLLCENTPEVPRGYLRGPQIILNLCKNTLQSLTLRSKLALQPPTERDSMIICDLSQHAVLTHLDFKAAFFPRRDHFHPHIPKRLVIDEVLATIPWQVCKLKTLNCMIYVGLDQALKPVTPGGALRLDTATPLPFFLNPAWNMFDYTVAQLANVRDMRVVVNITGLIPSEAKAVYDPQDKFYDSVDMGSLMEQWGQNMFVEFRKAPRADITVFASIGRD